MAQLCTLSSLLIVAVAFHMILEAEEGANRPKLKESYLSLQREYTTSPIMTCFIEVNAF